MKKFFASCVLAFATIAVFAQSGPQLVWEKASHDFGVIEENAKVQHVYKFTNKGNEPLLITNVQVTCGCTVPSWPKDPIMPGTSSEMLVQFNSAGKMGKQMKVVTVSSNAVNAESREIKFTAEIAPKKVAN